MKKIILLLFVLLPAVCWPQMKATYGSFEGIPYVFYDGPGTVLVVIAQGSGEFSTSLTSPNTVTINAASTYATYARAGKVYEFDILVAQSYKAPDSKRMASQTYLMKGLSRLIRSFNPSKVIGTGYSYGGQLMGYFMTNPAAIDAEVFDGYVIIAGNAKVSPDFTIHKDKPRFVVHGSADTAVPIWEGANICYKTNAVGPKHYVYADHYYDWKALKWIPSAMPDSAFSKFTVINGGGHSIAWQKAYNVEDAIGKQVFEFIRKVSYEAPKPIACAALLDTIAMNAIFMLPDSIKLTYKLIR